MRPVLSIMVHTVLPIAAAIWYVVKGAYQIAGGGSTFLPR